MKSKLQKDQVTNKQYLPRFKSKLDKKTQAKLLRILAASVGAHQDLGTPWVMGVHQFRKASRLLGNLLIGAGWKPPK